MFQSVPVFLRPAAGFRPLQQAQKIRRRLGSGITETLAEVTAGRGEKTVLGLGLHPFGGDPQTQLALISLNGGCSMGFRLDVPGG